MTVNLSQSYVNILVDGPGTTNSSQIYVNVLAGLQAETVNSSQLYANVLATYSPSFAEVSQAFVNVLASFDDYSQVSQAFVNVLVSRSFDPGIFLSQGTLLSVHLGEPDEYTPYGFKKLSYIDVGEVVDVEEYGGGSEIKVSVPLRTFAAVKKKQNYDYGALDFKVTRNPIDNGQIAVSSGFDGNSKGLVHSVRIIHPNGWVQYFTGIISKVKTDLGDSNNWISLNCSIEINNEIIDAPLY